MSNEEEKIANENLNSIREKNNRYLNSTTICLQRLEDKKIRKK